MKPKITTLFFWCNEITVMREFYSTILGLEETYFSDRERASWLSYSIHPLQLLFIQSKETLPVETEWARQPALPTGKGLFSSMVIQLSLKDFEETMERVKKNKVTLFYPDPKGSPEEGFVQFVRDPMGYTLELRSEK